MSDGAWWNDSGGGAGGDANDYQYNPDQTAAGPALLDANTTYSPPGQANPIDQYNFVADPNAPGGWQSYAPGTFASNDLAAFSNSSGQYPDDATAANAIANSYSQTPSVAGDGTAGYYNLPADQQAQWQSFYGSSLAPYAWGQQSGNYNVPAGAEGFNALPTDQQNIWYGTYGDQAPSIWAQQAAQNIQNQPSQLGAIKPPQPTTWANYPNLTYNAQNNWFDPATGRHTGWGSYGAGTQWTAPGWGVPGFGQEAIPIEQSNWAVLNDPKLQQSLAPGYIPGSGTYNQYRLDQGGLFGNVAGQMSNLRYGLGGTGDPTTGLEVQTPDQIVQGPKLFNSTRTSNWGQGDQAGTGLDYIATLFLRPDTPSGINTAAWSAPQQFWVGLGQQIANGQIQPTAAGWQVLAQKGLTPDKIGGQAPQQYANTPKGGSGTGQGPMGAGTQAFNYQAAYLDYLSARMNQLDIPGMKQQNQQFMDQLAFEQAKQKWLEQYQQQTFGEGQRQFNELQGLRQGELVGSYNGQQTLASRAEQNQTSLGYLNLLSKLRGPADMFQYLKVLNGTPGGIRDLVNAASGAYRMPATGGGQVTVGGYSAPTDLNTLLDQMNNPDYGAEGQNLNLPAPNQINAQSLIRMTPTQRQSLLAAYEAGGYSPEDVMSIFQNSLPRYAGQGGAGRVNLWR